MRIEDARSAKEELWNTFSGQIRTGELERIANRVALAHGSRARSLAGGSFAAALSADRPSGAPNYAVSLGVAVRPKGNYGVAVRVQASRGSQPTAERLREMFAGKADIDFRMIGTVRAYKPWYQDISRPLCIGPSVGHYQITAGTLGAFVTVRRKSGTFMLSNNHVLANVDNATRGDRILQPGPIDNLAPSQLIAGTFESAVVLKKTAPNQVDCAIAKINDNIDIEPRELWNVGLLAGTATPYDSDTELVFKIGRTSGLTWGRITAIELDPIEISMGSIVHAFNGQIEIEGTGVSPFSKPGDSGSLVVDPQYKAIGLLFAGSTTGGRNGKGLTYANPIDDVLDKLKASLVT